MKKNVLILTLIFSLLCTGLSAYGKNYNQFTYTPEQGLELISYNSPSNKDDSAYEALQNLTLLGILRQERSFSLANYVTLPDALKLIFRCAGLEQYAFDCGENPELRASLGFDSARSFSTSDGFIIAAYEKGLIDKKFLTGYLEYKPGYRECDYVVKSDVIVWISKMFELSPSDNFTRLELLGDTHLIPPAAKPYFAGMINAGIPIVSGNKYKACSLVKNEDLVTLLGLFTNKLLEMNNIQSFTSAITNVSSDASGNFSISTENEDSINCTPDNTCLLMGNNFTDNLYVLSNEKVKGRNLTYYVRDGKVIFASINISKPLSAYGHSVSHSLYFYDDLTGMAVFSDGEKYFTYFLADNAEIYIDGELSDKSTLLTHTDREFIIDLTGCNEFTLNKIVRLHTGGEK